MKEIRFIDMFCGIGGFRFGLERANKAFQEGQMPKQTDLRNKRHKSQSARKGNGKDGNEHAFNCVWSNDSDKYACQIYRENFTPNIKEEKKRIGEEDEKGLRGRENEPNDEGNKGLGSGKSRLCEQSNGGSIRQSVGGWHKPSELYEGNIRAVDADAVPEHDLLCAGFPCQSFSIAGRRGGFADIRGTLFQEICRVVGAKRTPYLLLENVKGLLSVAYTEDVQEWSEEDFDTDTGEPTAGAQRKHKAIPGTKGWVFLTILNSLWELGYDCQWEVLNSKDFGVPQNRERVFIVGHLRGKPRPKVFPVGESDEVSNKEGYERVAKFLTSTAYKGVGNDGTTLIYEGAIMSEQNQKWLEDGKKLSRNSPQGQRVYSSEGIASNICGDAGGLGGKTGLYAIPVLTPGRQKKRQHGRRFKESGEPAFTLTGQDIHGISDGMSIRRLTPLECERLQGFPDGWTEVGVANEKDARKLKKKLSLDANAEITLTISDTQRYKCLGNAVTVNVIEAIGTRLLEELCGHGD